MDNIMQAVVETDEKNKEKVDFNIPSPLFSSNEIMFPDGDEVERPDTRYGYQIGKMNFLIPDKLVSEVIQHPSIFNLPNSPSWIEGLINVRGNIIPVMNVSKFLKSFDDEKTLNILVMAQDDGNPSIAIMINDLPISLELNNSVTKIDNYPSEISEFISSGFKQNNFEWVDI